MGKKGKSKGPVGGPGGDSGPSRPPNQPTPGPSGAASAPRTGLPSSAESIEITMKLPAGKVGLVIGKGGETINKIKKETGATLWVDQQSRDASEADFKSLHIKGTQQQISEAREHVQRIIGDTELQRSQHPTQLQRQPPAQQQRQPPAQQQRQPPAQQQRQPPAQQQRQPTQPEQRQQAVQQPAHWQQQQGQQSAQQQQFPQQRQQQSEPAPSRPSSQASSHGSIHSDSHQGQQQPPPVATAPLSQTRQPTPPQQPSASSVSVTRGVEYMSLAPGTRLAGHPALMPPKRADRPTSERKGRPLMLETNHLPLTVANKKMAIYHYDVSMTPDKPFRFYRPAMEEFRLKHYQNRFPSFDGKKNLYSATRLPFQGDVMVDTVTINDSERGQPKEIKVAIQLVAERSLEPLLEYLRNGTSVNPPQTILQAIDIVLRQPAVRKFVPVGRSYFTPPSGSIVSLGDGLNLWYGFFQSAILGGKPYLNIDVAHKGFPVQQNCITALEEFARGRINPNQRVDEYAVRNFRSLIKGLKVSYKPPRTAIARIYKVNDLGKSAREHTFEIEGEGRKTVEQYFQSAYGYTIQYPHVPCLTYGTKGNVLPAELCMILENQVVLKKLNDNQTRTMVKSAATRPDIRKSKIINSMSSLRFNEDPHIKEFGLGVNTQFKQVEARVLPPPTIRYSTSDVRVDKGVWNSDVFLDPKSLTRWYIYCADQRTRDSDIDNLQDSLIREGRRLGMNMSKAIINRLRSDRTQQVENDFTNFVQQKAELVFVILPDRASVTYAAVKQIAELSVGLLTQCLKARTVSRLSPSTVGNILLKVNAKLNGINHNVSRSVWPAFFKRPVIVVGADVTHPSPDQTEIPSVAAVTASHDACAFHYNMKWRLQNPREEIITDLENIMVEQLMFFYKKTGAKPEHIMVFRDGVSEGQFEIVLRSELTAIQAACKRMGSSGSYQPPITFLVVQKRHHTRFFPLDSRDADRKTGNVPAGTIVDRDIVHPNELDFYLVSHASIQGTARPTKYHVLHDDAKMPEATLEEITYYLCHLFTRCTRSVSIPAPTYYAHLAAFRIRHYLEKRPVQLQNLSQEQKNHKIRDNIMIGSPMFFV